MEDDRSDGILSWNLRSEGAWADETPTAPEKTHDEERYFMRRMEDRTAMVVVTRSGEKLRGWIEWYDRDVLKLHSLTEPNIFLRKQQIKYIYEHDQEPGAEPVPTPPPMSRRERKRLGGSQ